MRLFRAISLLICCFVFQNQTVFAARIEKAFKALSIYNYFEAKQLFEKSIKKNTSAANYGLSLIYFRTDNPFHQLDSAFNCIQRAEASYSGTSEKSKTALKKFQFDYFAIIALRNQISTAFFQMELKNPTESGMNAFQIKHSWSQEHFVAISKRDSIAFSEAKKTNTSLAFRRFLDAYPEAEQRFEAENSFYRLQYVEQTQTGTLVAFIGFEKTYPQNPYVQDAQDQVFSLSTEKNTVADYNAFIQRFPSNRNVEQAWRNLYSLYMSDYSAERLEQFQKEFPNYPFKDELIRDQQLSQSILIPYKSAGQFGWMDFEGNLVIKAQYSSVGFFKEGLAYAEKNGKFGFVNKVNQIIVPFEFSSANEYEKGRAIVEKNGQFGLIDRSGKTILPIEFKDLGQFTEGLIYAQKDSLYGYFDGAGYQRIPYQYDEAFSFSNGIAKVTFKGLEGYIDVYGAFIVRPEQESINLISDSLISFEEDEFIQIKKRNGEVISELKSERIGKLMNDRAIFIQDSKIGYFNAQGKVIIAPQYALYPNSLDESEFVGTFAKVNKSGKYGVIDQNGKVIVPFQYLKFGRMGTYIAFEKGGKWGFIDLNNKVVIPSTYEYAESFQNNLAIVQQLTLQGAIDSKGQIVIPLQFTSVKRIDSTHCLVALGSKYGIYTETGKLVVPVEYNQIRKVQENLYVLMKDQELSYFHLIDNTIIQPKLGKL